MNKRYAIVLALCSIVGVGVWVSLSGKGTASLPEVADAPYKPAVIINMEKQVKAIHPPSPGRATVQAGPLDEAAQRLAARLAREPDDVDGWLLLARTYEYLQRPGEARKAMGEARAHGYAGTGANAAGGQASAAPSLRGRVQLDPGLNGKVRPMDTLFVYAKAVNGPGMPLAIARFHVSDLPVSFSLDDSMAMTPAMKLSKFPRVRVYARISRTGQAMPSSGDLQGASPELDSADAHPVNILIDHVL